MAKKNNGAKISKQRETRYVTKTTTPRSIYKKDSKGDYVFDYYEMEPFNVTESYDPPTKTKSRKKITLKKDSIAFGSGSIRRKLDDKITRRKIRD
jgi:hypothetical protein